MVKVLERKEWSKECTCRNCKSKLEAEISDFYYWDHHDYGGGTDRYYGFVCPVCNSENCFSVGAIPSEITKQFPHWKDHPVGKHTGPNGPIQEEGSRVLDL